MSLPQLSVEKTKAFSLTDWHVFRAAERALDKANKATHCSVPVIVVDGLMVRPSILTRLHKPLNTL